MDPVNIEYRIELGEHKQENFVFQLDGNTFEFINDGVSNPPPWTELSFRQCSHCPLNSEQHSRCPMALQLSDIVSRFHDTKSIDEVRLEVITKERTVIQTLAIQRAIASILGLILPICGCPKAAYMKPMARFHLPLASEEETVFRVTGMYLLSQYFLRHSSGKAGSEFDGLKKIYEDLHIVNAAIASRLQNATQSDSVKNAISLLDMYSILVPVLIEDQLEEMRGFFGAYLPEDKGEVTVTNNIEKAREFSMELVPLDGGQADDQPAWLKEVTVVLEHEATEDKEVVEIAEKQESVPVKFLDKAGLEMELEPLDDDKKAAFVLFNRRDAADQEESTKAVFKLSDDD